MSDHRIVGIHVTDRTEKAADIQSILSKHGRVIRTRLGLHDVTEAQASPHGLILLDTVGSDREVEAMIDELRRLTGVQVQSMFFSHPK